VNRPTTLLQKAAQFDSQNLAAARIIAADPERYPSMQVWADRVLPRLDAPAAEDA
jgi:hypothetical protein